MRQICVMFLRDWFYIMINLFWSHVRVLKSILFPNVIFHEPIFLCDKYHCGYKQASRFHGHTRTNLPCCKFSKGKLTVQRNYRAWHFDGLLKKEVLWKYCRSYIRVQRANPNDENFQKAVRITLILSDYSNRSDYHKRT